MPVLPVLRPPLFVVLTAIDYKFGGNGLILAMVYAACIFFSFAYAFLIINLFDDKVFSAIPYYQLILAVGFTVYPMNFSRPYLLADPVALTFCLSSIYYFSKYVLSGSKAILFVSAITALCAGLTQNYGLIPFIIFGFSYLYLNWRGNKEGVSSPKR